MTLEELKEIHKEYDAAKKKKVSADYAYRDEHGLPLSTMVFVEVDRGDTVESVLGMITGQKVNAFDFEIYYTVRPLDDLGRPNYDVLLGYVKRDGFEIVGEEKNEIQ